jgi:hypothetical protein
MSHAENNTQREERTAAEIASVINFIWNFTYHVWQFPSQTDRSAPLLLGHADVLRLQIVSDVLVPTTEITKNITTPKQEELI